MLLELAAYGNNVAAACEYMNISRKTYYQIKKAYDEGGVEALSPKFRRVPNLKNRVPDDVEEAVLKLSMVNPVFGKKKVSRILKEQGIQISPNSVMAVSLLKQLSINTPVLKMIVKYKTLQSQLKKIDSILRKVKDNKIHPLFNPIKSPYGALFSISPDILGIKGIKEFQDCFSERIKPFFRNRKNSIGIIKGISQDPNLKKDLEKSTNQYMVSHSIMKGLDCDGLFLAVVTGCSDFKLSKEFMLDRLTVSTIRHDLEVRYSTLFNWIRSFQIQILKQGYATYDNKKKYFDGLKSSNLEKRKTALNNSVKWILKY